MVATHILAEYEGGGFSRDFARLLIVCLLVGLIIYVARRP